MTLVLYTKLLGGARATKSSAQDGFWPDIAIWPGWTLWPTVQWCVAKRQDVDGENIPRQHYHGLHVVV